MRKIAIYLTVLLVASALYAEEKRFTVPVGDSPATGPSGAPVTIIEFLDFQ
jgi:hypothetical protein